MSDTTATTAPEPATTTATTFRRNAGKVKLGFLNPIAKAWWSRVFTFGAAKYNAWGWRERAAMASWVETSESLERHLDAWRDGQDLDPESGLPHMAHIMCNAAMLLEFWELGQGKDDRFKPSERPDLAEVIRGFSDRLSALSSKRDTPT